MQKRNFLQNLFFLFIASFILINCGGGDGTGTSQSSPSSTQSQNTPIGENMVLMKVEDCLERSTAPGQNTPSFYHYTHLTVSADSEVTLKKFLGGELNQNGNYIKKFTVRIPETQRAQFQYLWGFDLSLNPFYDENSNIDMKKALSFVGGRFYYLTEPSYIESFKDYTVEVVDQATNNKIMELQVIPQQSNLDESCDMHGSLNLMYPLKRPGKWAEKEVIIPAN